MDIFNRKLTPNEMLQLRNQTGLSRANNGRGSKELAKSSTTSNVSTEMATNKPNKRLLSSDYKTSQVFEEADNSLLKDLMRKNGLVR